ncbi:MAG: HNH endonuclease [Acidobacteriota bacterium]
MNFFIGVTDNNWFELLSSLSQKNAVDEVNFWQPSGSRRFQAITPGEPFLFKLHSPLNFIVGGGFFAHFSLLSSTIAWDAFGELNGARTYSEMRASISRLRSKQDLPTADFQIGCILLEQPFFFSQRNWIPVPADWSPNIVQGKTYSMLVEPGKSLWDRVRLLLGTPAYRRDQSSVDEQPRFGKETLVKPRLGQGSFKVLVTDAYRRSCAITAERALPALEAAHIKPYASGGEHRIDNGVLLRADMHRLFDRGYITITGDLRVEVSRKIREEFENGRYYYTFHGKSVSKPDLRFDPPEKDFLIWHNEQIFKG